MKRREREREKKMKNCKMGGTKKEYLHLVERYSQRELRLGSIHGPNDWQ